MFNAGDLGQHRIAADGDHNPLRRDALAVTKFDRVPINQPCLRLVQGHAGICQQAEIDPIEAIDLAILVGNQGRPVETRGTDFPAISGSVTNLISDMRSEDGSFGKLLLSNFTPAGARNTMLKSYGRMAKRFEPRLELMFDRLCQAESLPAIIHCHVGKDRTGFACAMILWALDVPHDEILRDYLATATASDPVRLRAAASSFIADMTGVTPPPEVIEPIVAVSEEYLDTAFKATAEEFGSVDAYLTTIGGMTAEKRARLQQLLVG